MIGRQGIYTFYISLAANKGWGQSSGPRGKSGKSALEISLRFTQDNSLVAFLVLY